MDLEFWGCLESLRCGFLQVHLPKTGPGGAGPINVWEDLALAALGCHVLSQHHPVSAPHPLPLF